MTTKSNTSTIDATAVEDSRAVRRKIAEQHFGNIRQQIEESNRVTEELKKQLKIVEAEKSTGTGRANGTRDY